MTDDELKRIEERASEGVGAVYDEHADCWMADADRDTLVAEVRRLRGLIKDCNVYGWCAWCRQVERNPDRHDADCPAFTPSGDVK